MHRIGSRLRTVLHSWSVSPGKWGISPALLLWVVIQSGAFAEEPVKVKDLNTPREFPLINTRAEWDSRAKSIREQVLVSCGLWPLPEKTPLNAHIFGRIDRDGYSVEKVYFQSMPGFYVGGNLYRPSGAKKGRCPGVLNPHGHWKEGRLADTKDGSIAARCIQFARQGMVAFSYDMIGFNDTFFPDHGNVTADKQYLRHRQFATNQACLLWNISPMGLQTWNSIRALDFLASLPEVDTKRLACTGESGGGTQTYMLGAVDDRLAVQSPVVMVSHTMQGGCSCENAPGLRVEYSNMEIAAAAAPRPQLLVAATGDWTRATLTVEGPAIQHIYELLNAADHFKFVRFDFGHNYNQTSREAVYEWFGKWLLTHADAQSTKEQPYKKEPDADLRVWPQGKLPADALTEEQFTKALERRSEKQLAQLSPRSRSSLKRYKETMMAAWRHTLQIADPPRTREMSLKAGSSPGGHRATKVEFGVSGQERRIKAVYLAPATDQDKGGVIVVLVAATGPSEYCDETGAASGLAKRLIEKGTAVLVITDFSSATPKNQFANFYTTYNRTEVQERVGDLVTVCAQARRLGNHKRNKAQVVLCGSGRAGLWALLAAPAADGVIADCDELDVSDDGALLAPDLFCPGIRKIGGFEGSATLAAPHPLLLHQVSSHFPVEMLRTTYRGIGKESSLRIEDRRVADEAIVEWIERSR
jgi:dienelactone hydrolase